MRDCHLPRVADLLPLVLVVWHDRLSLRVACNLSPITRLQKDSLVYVYAGGPCNVARPPRLTNTCEISQHYDSDTRLFTQSSSASTFLCSKYVFPQACMSSHKLVVLSDSPCHPAFCVSLRKFRVTPHSLISHHVIVDFSGLAPACVLSVFTSKGLGPYDGQAGHNDGRNDNGITITILASKSKEHKDCGRRLMPLLSPDTLIMMNPDARYEEKMHERKHNMQHWREFSMTMGTVLPHCLQS